MAVCDFFRANPGSRSSGLARGRKSLLRRVSLFDLAWFCALEAVDFTERTPAKTALKSFIHNHLRRKIRRTKIGCFHMLIHVKAVLVVPSLRIKAENSPSVKPLLSLIDRNIIGKASSWI